MVAGGSMEESEVTTPCTTTNKQYNKIIAVSYNTIQGGSTKFTDQMT